MAHGLVEVCWDKRQSSGVIAIPRYAHLSFTSVLQGIYKEDTHADIYEQAEYDEIGPSIVRRFALLGGPGGS